jgi:hypothetical protein
MTNVEMATNVRARFLPAEYMAPTIPDEAGGRMAELRAAIPRHTLMTGRF